jgi:hypothetical protein
MPITPPWAHLRAIKTRNCLEYEIISQYLWIHSKAVAITAILFGLIVSIDRMRRQLVHAQQKHSQSNQQDHRSDRTPSKRSAIAMKNSTVARMTVLST